MFFSSAFNCNTAFILNPGTKFGITSLVFTSASKNNISEDIKQLEKMGKVEIYYREKVTELLNKYPTKITELVDRDKRYSIEDIKNYIIDRHI